MRRQVTNPAQQKQLSCLTEGVEETLPQTAQDVMNDQGAVNPGQDPTTVVWGQTECGYA